MTAIADVTGAVRLQQQTGGENRADDTVLRRAAQNFETAFLTEMLAHTGVGEMSESFNGGAGEAGFSGFLVQEYAAEISRTGRIGLADQVYAALKQRVAS